MANKRDAGLHPDYLEREQKFYEKIAKLHAEERELRKLIRANVAFSDEERMDVYQKGFLEVEEKVQKAQHEFFATISNERFDLERVLHDTSGGDAHLIQAASLDAERREQLLDLALNTAQPALAKALAQTARQNNEWGTFHKWANDDPERAEALRKYRGIPSHEVLEDRTYKATSLPKADFQGIKPTAQEVRAAELEARHDEHSRQRAAFYSLPAYGTPG